MTVEEVKALPHVTAAETKSGCVKIVTEAGWRLKEKPDGGYTSRIFCAKDATLPEYAVVDAAGNEAKADDGDLAAEDNTSAAAPSADGAQTVAADTAEQAQASGGTFAKAWRSVCAACSEVWQWIKGIFS